MRPSHQSVFLSAVAAVIFAALALGLGAAGCGGGAEPTGAAGTTTKKDVSPSGLPSSYDDVMEKAPPGGVRTWTLSRSMRADHGSGTTIRVRVSQLLGYVSRID